MGLFGFGKKHEVINSQPIEETRKKEPEMPRPLNESTDREKAEQKYLTAKELYEMAETALSVDPSNGNLQEARKDAYDRMINTEDEYKKLKMLGIK